MPIVPPADSIETKATTSVRLRPSVIRELDSIAERTCRSRNEVIEYILQWGIQQVLRELEVQEAHRAAEAKKPSKK